MLTGAVGMSGASEPNGLMPYGREVTAPATARIGAPGEERMRDTTAIRPEPTEDRPVRWTLRTAGAVTAAALFAGALSAPAAHARDERLTDLVNPFIGTENEGNTFPGATVPFGMVQLSPDTGHKTGYRYSQTRVRGFSLVHLSGVGCRIGGDLPVLPTTGDITSTDHATYAAEYGHDQERATPGYYRVGLDSGIDAELTATARTGVQRYTFPSTTKANVLLNAGQSLHTKVANRVEILDDRTVRTTITGSGFCRGTKPYTVHTITRFDRPFTAYGTWDGSTVTDGSRTGGDGAYVRFDTTDGDRTVEATTALSYVDAEGAAGNLSAEGGRSFGAVREAARAAWEARLADVRVTGGSETLRRAFYSSLYRSFLAPNIGSDADGRYTGWDLRIHRARDFTYYQNWSLWDTYRTQAQLLSLLAPREARDMALSVLKIDEEGGWLPKWGYGTVETNIMTGDPVTPFLTHAYQQGLLHGHEERTYRALRKNADGVPPTALPMLGREANQEYIANGFAPYLKGRPRTKPGDSDYHWGASVTLEYALSDAMLAQMARDLGHKADADRYARRAQNYRAVFDPATGFFRPRTAREPSPATPIRPGGGVPRGHRLAVPVAGPAGSAGPGGPARGSAGRQRPARRLLRVRPDEGGPGRDGPRGVGERPVRLLQRGQVQPPERGRPHRPVHLSLHRPALEDDGGRARRADPFHRRPDRYDGQRRHGHDVRLARPVRDRDLPGTARLRHLGPVHPRLRPGRPRP